ncbi:hypothetical protein ADN00_09735 [Ornatilinea apprima]|uniref:Uncharacterized protein n=1 Tax=Ornatilinea apprima TaxID=1134406 RepID=A0A0P6XNL9_9CHLR|nr:hypothetical protein ADN00_09735 [Ornatilinea apprima]
MKVIHQDQVRESVQVFEAFSKLGKDLHRARRATAAGGLDGHLLEIGEGAVNYADGVIGDFHSYPLAMM